MKKILLTLSLSLGILSGWAFAEFTGKVISVIDGNTIEVLNDAQETYKIAFFGIDSPELTQDYGDKAKKFLEKLALNEQVHVQLQGKDRWGNYLGVVLIDGKIDPRIELLQEGLAWTAEKNPLPELEEHRTKAQEKSKGLWKQESPIAPWIYRRQQSMLQAKSS